MQDMDIVSNLDVGRRALARHVCKERLELVGAVFGAVAVGMVLPESGTEVALCMAYAEVGGHGGSLLNMHDAWV